MSQNYTSSKLFKTPSFNINHLSLIISLFLVVTFSISLNAQKRGGVKDLEPRSCTQYIGNGLYRVNFGYDNPNKQEITLNEENSIVIRGNGKIKSKGINTFKPGVVDRAFTVEFNEKETVEWKVTNPSGKEFIVTANVNSAHCSNTGIIFPVYGQENGKSNTLIGLELTALVEGNSGDEPSNIIYQINDDQEVLIEIVPEINMLYEVIDLLLTKFGLNYSPDPLLSDFIVNPDALESSIDVFFPIDRLLELNDYPLLINFVRPLYSPIQNSGITVSQGDNAQKSDAVREAFKIKNGNEAVPVDGSGIKIGVISDSYNTQPFTGKTRATIDEENGDLPGTQNPNGYNTAVEILKDFPFGSASDEGRAMMHILHDIAPGAELAFNTGVLSPRDFEIAISNLDNAGCTMVVDDITFASEPMFGESKISKKIKEFTAKPGRFHVTSAGNFSNDGYMGTFTSSSGFPSTNFIPNESAAVAHVFGNTTDGTEDVFQKIQVVEGTYMLVLQWNENMASQNGAGADTDLDIYLVDDSGNLLVGNNRFNIGGDPTEFLVFQATGIGEANILITSADGTPPPNLAFRYIAFRAEGLDFLEYQGAPTVTGHAMTPEVVTVGAVDYRIAETPETQAFSSMAGNLSNNLLIEIDFTAPDGGNTNVSSIGQDISADEDDFPNFFGTSASAPHSAAAIALMLSAIPSWYPDGFTNLSDEVLTIFKNSATPYGQVEKSGAGLINSEEAFLSIASPTPVLTGISFEEGKTPGSEILQVTISGKYLPEEPIVYFGGNELEIVSTNDGEIVVQVEEFTGNPELVVYTAPKTPGGTDGGNSNPLYFFDGTFVNIIADDVTVEFGQKVEFSYRIEGLPEGTTLESLGLPEVQFTTPANFPYPDVNSYNITPYFEAELTSQQTEDYQITFTDGLLAVTTKDLQLKPIDATFKYGEPIFFSYDFNYESAGIADNDDFLSYIQGSYATGFYQENTLALVNNFKALINEIDILNLLNQGSWISSENVINNKLRAVINGMKVVDLDDQHFTDYVTASSDGTTNKFKAVINKLRAVVNAEDLFNNNVELFIDEENGGTNTFRAIVNGTELGGENDTNDYSSVFAIIDAEDATNPIPEFYSLGLVTGLDVTISPDEHYMYPGAFIAPVSYNFNVTYGFGRLTILPETLHVESQDLVIYQGETPQIDPSSFSITGFVYDDTVETVFPDGIPYYFVDNEGNEYVEGDTGVFFIRIREPENYVLEYDVEGILYVNPSGSGVKKVRTYLDCVEYNRKAQGLKYVAHFRYENPNSQSIYVLQGPDNYLSGDAEFEGAPPTIFLPGQGVFEVLFDGNNLKWELTTMDSTNKTSTSSDASSTSGKCESSSEKNQLVSYVVYPNPVSTILNIDQNNSEPGLLEIFNSYGIRSHSQQLNSVQKTHQLDISSYIPGIYLIRVTTQYEIFTSNIIKE